MLVVLMFQDACAFSLSENAYSHLQGSNSVLLVVSDCDDVVVSLHSKLPSIRFSCSPDNSRVLNDGTAFDSLIIEWSGRHASPNVLAQLLRMHGLIRYTILITPDEQLAHADADTLSELLDIFMDRHELWFVAAEHADLCTLTKLGDTEAHIVRAIKLRQSQDNCAELQFVIYDGWSNDGLGSLIHKVTQSLQFAFLTNRILVLVHPKDWIYGSKEDCADNALSCYFHWMLTPHCYDYALEHAQTEVDNPAFYRYEISSNFNPRVSSYREAVPYSARKSPFVYSAIGRPKRHVRLYVREQQRRLQLPATFAGVHVRHGDKAREQPLISIEMYVETLKSLGVNGDVWLATDDPTLVSYSTSGLRFIANTDALMELSNRNLTLSQEYYAAPNKTLFFLNTWLDISMLVQSTPFVGMRFSGMSEIVDQLKSFIEQKPDVLFLSSRNRR